MTMRLIFSYDIHTRNYTVMLPHSSIMWITARARKMGEESKSEAVQSAKALLPAVQASSTSGRTAWEIAQMLGRDGHAELLRPSAC